MSSRLPRAARAVIPAALPPEGLEGMEPQFSRLVETKENGSGAIRTWHVLDNGEQLAARGLTPIGTILCVHGNPTWSYLWRRLLATSTTWAAAGQAPWRVIAVDQLEMGFSERTGAERPLATRVADLAALTDALALDGPVVTLGHDWGGVVSLGWAIDHPELCRGVMLLNTAVHQSEQHPIPAPLRLALRVLGTGTVSTPAFLETTLALAHPALSRSVKDGYRAPYRGAERRGGIGGFVADIPVDAAHPSYPELQRIAAGIRQLDVPALMLWGPRDPIFSDRYLDDLINRMPHADVHRFEGAGHLLAEDVDYASTALTWLDDRGVHEAARASNGLAAPEVPGAARPEPALRPLWSYLDELADSSDTALVELAPPGGGEPRVVSWRLLARRVRELAAGLSAAGVQRGHRVSLLVQPGADLTAVLYACLRIGAVVVVADAGLGLRGLTRAVRGAQPDHVIGAAPGLVAARLLGWPGQKIATVRFPALLRRALGIRYTLGELIRLGRSAPLPAAPSGASPAAVLFTSGSTGPAKGVVYTHAQLGAVRDTLAAQYGIGPGTGLVAGFAPFALLGPALGTRSATPDMNVTSPKTLTATAVAAAAAAVEADIVFLSPAAVANVVATADALSDSERSTLNRVRRFLSAGAPVSEPLLAAANRLMPAASAHTPYGMTEGLLLTDISLDGIRAAGSAAAGAAAGGAGAGIADPGGVCVGRPTGTTIVRISALDADGLATGEPTPHPGPTGEIVVSAPHLKDSYDRLWLTDRASRTGTDPSMRVHRTGDVGHLDVEGRLWVEGRIQHVIVTAEGVITPVGPEQRIESVPAVGRAAVVGIGPRGTQQLVAVVETTVPVRRTMLADRELAASVRQAAALPLAAVLVVSRMPTDIRHNSKIDRARLGVWAADILGGGRMGRP